LGFSGFHGIGQLGDNLMDVAALRTLKGPDMKTHAAGRNSRQYRCCFADWT
jgi:hypothetical protein